MLLNPNAASWWAAHRLFSLQTVTAGTTQVLLTTRPISRHGVTWQRAITNNTRTLKPKQLRQIQPSLMVLFRTHRIISVCAAKVSVCYSWNLRQMVLHQYECSIVLDSDFFPPWNEPEGTSRAACHRAVSYCRLQSFNQVVCDKLLF